MIEKIENTDTHCLIFNTVGIIDIDLMLALQDIYPGENNPNVDYLFESLVKTDHEPVFTGSYEDCVKHRDNSIKHNVACYIREIGRELHELKFLDGLLTLVVNKNVK